MKRLAAVSMVIGAAVATAAYQYFADDEFVVRLSETDLERGLRERFPLTGVAIRGATFDLSNPRLHLAGDSDRVGVRLDVISSGGDGPGATGSLELSCAVVYRSGSGRFYLADPLMQRIDLPGLGRRRSREAAPALLRELAALFGSVPLYALQPAARGRNAAPLFLTEVMATGGRLSMTLVT
ncbi:MAG: hypothetical protein R3228_15605 [Halioglobus sp.]|nr:hypothetical protein [Halioglobus sp.]